MGMFGAIYYLTMLIGSGIEGIGRNIEKRKSYRHCHELRAKGENPSNIYFDHSGKTYDLDTGKQVFFYYEKGHYIKEDIRGSFKVDLTEKEKQNEISREIFKGSQVIPYMDCNEIRKEFERQNPNNTELIRKLWNTAPLKVYIHNKTRKFVVPECITLGRVAVRKEKIEMFDTGFEFISLIEDASSTKKIQCWIDIHTNEIIDIDIEHHKKFGFGNKYNKIGEKIGEVTLEEVWEAIEKFNNMYKKGELDCKFGVDINNPFIKMFSEKYI